MKKLKSKPAGPIKWGVEHRVFHQATNGKFVNLETGEVREKKEFYQGKKTFQVVTLVSESQQPPD